MDAPALVTFTAWGVPPGAVPAAVARMAVDRAHLRRVPGLRFGKLLGTGSGRTFTLRDADPLHWALLAAWDSPADAAAFAGTTTSRRWAALSRERLVVRLRPLASRGRWARRTPFGDPQPRTVAGPVAALTRARLRMSRARSFWRAVPAVSADLRGAPGLRLAVGIGEAPVGLQGTFSIWDGARPLVDFAYRRAAHQDAIARTATQGWYAEELFARFEVLDVAGTFDGVRPLADGPAQGPAGGRADGRADGRAPRPEPEAW